MVCDIYVRGEIGGEDPRKSTTELSFRDQIDPDASEYLIHINSTGGDVYEGVAIGTIIENLGKKTTAFIEGQCASIATYIASSCDRVVITPHGDWMIHYPTAQLQGTAKDFISGAKQLERIKSDLIRKYLPRTSKKGIGYEKIDKMMDEETSMSADEALAMGFVDEVQGRLKAVAKWDLNKFTMESNKDKNATESWLWFKSFSAKWDKFFKSLEIANEIPMTLEDGTVVMVLAETPEQVVGAEVLGPDGAPLPDGTYPAKDASGNVLQLVVAGGKVTSAEPAAAPEDNQDDNKMKEENEALKNKVAELEASLKAKGEEVKVANENARKFSNSLKEIKKEVDELKKGTFGEQDAPDQHAADRKFKNEDEGRNDDPMAGLGRAYIHDNPHSFKQKQA